MNNMMPVKMRQSMQKIHKVQRTMLFIKMPIGRNPRQRRLALSPWSTFVRVRFGNITLKEIKIEPDERDDNDERVLLSHSRTAH
jgi:hypothetical protein